MSSTLNYLLHLSKREMSSITLCPVILTKGKRKNLPCNRKVLDVSKIEKTESSIPLLQVYCKFHTVKSEPVAYCTVILTKGERKNQTCNRKTINIDSKMCKIHTTLEDKRPYNPYVDNESDIKIDFVNDIICSMNRKTNFKTQIKEMKKMDENLVQAIQMRTSL